MNQVLGISTKQICLSLSDVAASLRRALLVVALGWKPLSLISPLTVSRFHQDGADSVIAHVHYVRSLLKGLKAIARRCSSKKLFWKILQNSQENTRTGVFLLYLILFLVKLQTIERKTLQPRCFPCKYYKIFSEQFFWEFIYLFDFIYLIDLSFIYS